MRAAFSTGRWPNTSSAPSSHSPRTVSRASTCNGATILAKEANDYSFSSTITLPPVTVKQMTNLTFDWSGVSKDFLGHT